MIIRDGKCYAESPAPILKITAACQVAPYCLDVTFNNKEERRFDGHSLLDGEIDVAPEFVYGNSVPV